jgi:hypothetical protein
MLHIVPNEMRAEAESALRRRLASSSYTLVVLREAREAAWPALQADLVRAIADSDLLRVLTRAWDRRAIVERRRDKRSG